MLATEATIKERPILFSGPMVRAILAGRKTMTRRVVKTKQPKEWAGLNHLEYARDGMPIWWSSPPSDEIRQSDYYDHGMPCPYGKPGERLWVRETWQQSRLIRKGGGERCTVRSPARGLGDLHYAADHFAGGPGETDEPPTWRPSIHMPRWASRINLEVVAVRVERLASISTEDAWREGCEDKTGSMGWSPQSAKIWFRRLWEQINGDGSWDANPWVWVVQFQPAKPPE